jgi:hypothetical protein
MPRPLAFLLLAAAALLASCGTTVDRSYGGEPLATLVGRASLDADDRPGGTVRLTLAWYPMVAGDDAPVPSAPKGILPQDVAFNSVFDDAALPVLQPPPPDAIVPLGGQLQGVRGVMGWLLAYVDGNGNQRLDVTPARGPAIDRVVGSSFTLSGLHYVLYLQDAPPAATGLQRGFNLVRVMPVPGGQPGEVTGGPVPLSTPVPLALSSGSDLFLQMMACEVAWRNEAGLEPPCGVQLPRVEPPPPPPPPQVEVTGFVERYRYEARVNLVVWDGEVQRTDASVELEGRPLLYDLQEGGYVLEEFWQFPSSGPLTLVVRVDGGELRRTLEVPATFVLGPEPRTQVRRNAPVDVWWGGSSGHDGWRVVVRTEQEEQLHFAFLSADEHSLLLTAPDVPGWYSIDVSAVARASSAGERGELELRRTWRTAIEVLP